MCIRDSDPIENIKKFMSMIKKEQNKINPPKKEVVVKPPKHEELPHDSVSEITDLSDDAILAKYTGENMSQL